MDWSLSTKISRNWYLAAVTLAIISNFIAYILIFDHEAEIMLFTTTAVLLIFAYYLKNFIVFREDEIESEVNVFPEFVLGKNGLIQNANTDFISKYSNYSFLEIGRNFASLIPQDTFNKMISPLNFGKPQFVILNSRNDLSIKNFISITKGPANSKDGFEVLLLKIDSTNDSFDAESHQQRLQAIGQLAIGISHDFNNVLTAIRGYSDLLQEKISEESDIFEDVVQIKENCQRASALVRQLLTFSRKHEVNYSKLDLYDVVAHAYKLLGRLLGEKIVINIDKKNENNLIYADKNQIEQVIINLALNAKDAMVNGGTLDISIGKRKISNSEKQDLNKMFRPSGSGEIEIGNYIELKIVDTGNGIGENILSKVFEPFFTTKSKQNGTGLGLSTVFSIIKQTGGHLLVDSNKNGTNFTILFQEFVGSNLIKKDYMRSDSQVKDNSKNSKIVVLVVEDEEPVRVFSAHALRNKGYHVIEAENAEMALDVFKQNNGNIDILVSDVIMPGMNGPELASKITKMNEKIDVILMSGYTEEEILPFCDQKFQFLSKPFSLNKLIETVANAQMMKEKV